MLFRFKETKVTSEIFDYSQHEFLEFDNDLIRIEDISAVEKSEPERTIFFLLKGFEKPYSVKFRNEDVTLRTFCTIRKILKSKIVIPLYEGI